MFVVFSWKPWSLYFRHFQTWNWWNSNRYRTFFSLCRRTASFFMGPLSRLQFLMHWSERRGRDDCDSFYPWLFLCFHISNKATTYGNQEILGVASCWNEFIAWFLFLGCVLSAQDMEERKLEMKHIWAPRLDFFLAVGQKSEKAVFFFPFSQFSHLEHVSG